MIKAFIDTNIIVDLLANRKPHSKFAIELFSGAEQKKLKLYTSTHSIVTAHYLLKKFVAEKELRTIFTDLLDYVHAISIDEAILKRGLKSKHKDFEDAIQMITAASVPGIDFIVTRNLKDFKDSEIMVLSPDEAVSKI